MLPLSEKKHNILVRDFSVIYALLMIHGGVSNHDVFIPNMPIGMAGIYHKLFVCLHVRTFFVTAHLWHGLTQGNEIRQDGIAGHLLFWWLATKPKSEVP